MKVYNEEETLKNLHSANVDLQKHAFNDVVSFYSEKLYRQIRKMVFSHDDTSDLLQNTFIKAWLNIESFRGESKLSTWLYRIAFNETITFLNKENARNTVSFDAENSHFTERFESDEYFDGDALQIKLQKAIATLPEKQRLVFNTRYYEDMPYNEMSEIFGTSVGSLKASYHHAVKKIEKYLNSSDTLSNK
ncbi:MAG: RNA polymerase sigma factor [Dysgonamonadaceae bacterium]|jgi:RNA polymerase sigma-70 factor (ECF subfamily)|nr:RNA polymerase sigma factor [Dysgonamonadaceae bacterium]